MGTNRQRKLEEKAWNKERDRWLRSFASKITSMDNYPELHGRDCDICAESADLTYYNLRFMCRLCYEEINWLLFKPHTADHVNFETLMTDMYRRLPKHKQVARYMKYGEFDKMWDDWNKRMGEK